MEQEINRQLTRAFINNDPTSIVLIPRAKVEEPDGGFMWADLPARPAQTFKIINQNGGTNGKDVGADGINTKFEFILLGNWDAQIAIGDHWYDVYHEGSTWTVTGILPANGYEVKATVVAQGQRTIGG